VKSPNAPHRQISLTSRAVQSERGGHRPRAKGDHIEREIVSRYAVSYRRRLLGAGLTVGDHGSLGEEPLRRQRTASMGEVIAGLQKEARGVSRPGVNLR
jgi:hypothetical protein